jgi:hypothetical protein
VGRDVEIEAFRIDRWPAKEFEIPVDEEKVARERSTKEYIRINEDSGIGGALSQGEYLHELLCVPTLHTPPAEQPPDPTPKARLLPPLLHVPRKNVRGGHHLQVRISAEMPRKMSAILGINHGHVGVPLGREHLH